MRTKNLNNILQSTAETKTRDLPIKFTGKGEVRGFTFEQVYSNTKWYVYQVSSYGTSWYEVFQRRKLNGKEIYPKAKQFGISAWQVGTPEKALLKIAHFQKSDTHHADYGLSIPDGKSCDSAKTLKKKSVSGGLSSRK